MSLKAHLINVFHMHWECNYICSNDVLLSDLRTIEKILKKQAFSPKFFHDAGMLLIGKGHNLIKTWNEEKNWLKAEICKQLEARVGESGR